jgi:MoxR-like ATPase
MIKLQNLTIDNRPSNYLPSPGLLNALEVAYMLKRPLLLTGEPGTGKTQFAFWAADQLARSDGFQAEPYVYNTKTSSTAKDLFYHYDAIAHFRETRTNPGGNTSAGGTSQTNASTTTQTNGQPTERTAADFIQLRALGLAITGAIGKKDCGLSPAILAKSDIIDHPRGSVVLIDEIDKASRDFPNDLLNEIENYEFEITELNQRVRLTDERQRQNIIVILTSNFEKNLPDAFLRRCIYYHIEFPTKERLFEIIIRRLDISKDDYSNIEKRVDDFFRFQQFPNISKRPSTSECIDWIRVLQKDNLLGREFFLGSELIPEDDLTKYLSMLIKSKDDLLRLLAR